MCVRKGKLEVLSNWHTDNIIKYIFFKFHIPENVFNLMVLYDSLRNNKNLGSKLFNEDDYVQKLRNKIKIATLAIKS